MDPGFWAFGLGPRYGTATTGGEIRESIIMCQTAAWPVVL